MSTVTYNDLLTIVTGLGNKIRDNLWASNKSYKVGDILFYQNKEYRVNTAFTSTSTFSDTNLDLIGDGAGTAITEWTASTSYAIGDLVIYNNILYQCLTANSDASFIVANWQEIGGGGGTSIDNWVASTSYSVDDLVIYNNTLYKCITSNSDASWTAAKWQGISIENIMTGATSSVNGVAGLVPQPLAGDEEKFLMGDGTWQSVDAISDWTASTSYALGDLVIYNNVLYQCTTANSDAAFTAANWQEIGKDATLKYWASATNYNAGAVVIYSNALYKCTTTHTSGSTFDTSEAANWSRLYPTFVGSSAGSDGVEGIVPKPLAGEQTRFLSGDGTWKDLPKDISIWTASTSYAVDDLVIQNSTLYKCTTANNDATFDSSKWQEIGSSGSGLEDWQANTSYSVGDIFVAENQIWKVVTAHTSGSTFSVTSDIEEYVPKQLTSAQVQALISGFTPSGSGSGSIVNYSTTEQNTGQKWIDSKDIYQITFDGYTIASGSANTALLAYNTSSLGIDTVVSIDGIAYHGDSYPVNWYGGTTSEYICCYHDSGVYVKHDGFNTYSVRVTLKYTKT